LKVYVTLRVRGALGRAGTPSVKRAATRSLLCPIQCGHGLTVVGDRWAMHGRCLDAVLSVAR
jgi:hypothetical protein